MSGGLFDGERADVTLDTGAVVLVGFARAADQAIVEALHAVAATAPFRHMLTPGGRRMSVAMTSCGEVGWVSDASGYRYATHDPVSGSRWPADPGTIASISRARPADVPDSTASRPMPV